jgi:hypothetical protein
MRKMVPDVSCNAERSTTHALAGAMAEVSKYDRIATLDALEFSRTDAPAVGLAGTWEGLAVQINVAV